MNLQSWQLLTVKDIIVCLFVCLQISWCIGRLFTEWLSRHNIIVYVYININNFVGIILWFKVDNNLPNGPTLCSLEENLSSQLTPKYVVNTLLFSWFHGQLIYHFVLDELLFTSRFYSVSTLRRNIRIE